MGDEEESGSHDAIEFSAKYGNWVVIKKMSIRQDTKPEEISFHLAGIRQTLDKKAFEFLKIDTQKLDAYAEKLSSGVKKNYDGLSEALKMISSQESKRIVAEAAGKEEHGKIASAYLFRRVAQNLGLDFDVSQEMLAKIYKDLKIKKPLGRQKKAQA